MDEATYQNWWPLHIRHAKGESLTPEEQAAYERGRDQLYAEESLDGNVEELRLLRTHISEMEAQLDRMMEQYQALKAQAENREDQLSERVKQHIGVSG